jgi:hypothetical protein
MLRILKSLTLLTSFASAGEHVFRNSSDIMDMNDGAFQGLMNQTIMNDAKACYKYSLVLFWDGVDTIKYFTDPFLAVTTVGLMMHKAPIIYFQCGAVLTDIEYMDEIFKIFDDVGDLSLYTHLLDNIMWNLGDVLQNIIEARVNLENREYKDYGQNIGQIVSDIFFVNPVDDAIWTEENSRIINEDGSAEKVPSSFYGELNVESSKK